LASRASSQTKTPKTPPPHPPQNQPTPPKWRDHQERARKRSYKFAQSEGSQRALDGHGDGAERPQCPAGLPHERGPRRPLKSAQAASSEYIKDRENEPSSSGPAKRGPKGTPTPRVSPMNNGDLASAQRRWQETSRRMKRGLPKDGSSEDNNREGRKNQKVAKRWDQSDKAAWRRL